MGLRDKIPNGPLRKMRTTKRLRLEFVDNTPSVLTQYEAQQIIDAIQDKLSGYVHSIWKHQGKAVIILHSRKINLKRMETFKEVAEGAVDKDIEMIITIGE